MEVSEIILLNKIEIIKSRRGEIRANDLVRIISGIVFGEEIFWSKNEDGYVFYSKLQNVSLVIDIQTMEDSDVRKFILAEETIKKRNRENIFLSI